MSPFVRRGDIIIDTKFKCLSDALLFCILCCFFYLCKAPSFFFLDRTLYKFWYYYYYYYYIIIIVAKIVNTTFRHWDFWAATLDSVMRQSITWSIGYPSNCPDPTAGKATLSTFIRLQLLRQLPMAVLNIWKKIKNYNYG